MTFFATKSEKWLIGYLEALKDIQIDQFLYILNVKNRNDKINYKNKIYSPLRSFSVGRYMFNLKRKKCKNCSIYVG